ncbi:Tetratricopeptide-like helical [Penicillium sp. CMV-2018d]|nr:Tetratricopeptide-like helical [Penicillium sp. CMV-2018d]
MPLAIVQTTSYIRNRAPRCSVSQYLKRSDREAIKLQKKDAAHLYPIFRRVTFSYKLLRSLRIQENLIRHRPIANYVSTLEPLSDFSDRETSESDLGPDLEDDIVILREGINLLEPYTKCFLPVNTKTRGGVGRSFLIPNPHCHSGQHHLSLYKNELRRFIAE